MREQPRKEWPQLTEYRVNKPLEAERLGKLGQGKLEEMLDKPEYKEYPEFRAALLKHLKELGRVPPEKE
jgi:hypothetical protein